MTDAERLKATTHTPGPWRVTVAAGGTGRPEIVRAVDGLVVRVVMQRAGAVSPSDARLMAAAPDLLEALKQLAQKTVYVDNGYCSQCHGWSRRNEPWL